MPHDIADARFLHEDYASLPSGRVWYRDSITGVPVIFLHAMSGNSLLWEKQIYAFIGAGYRFIAFDRAGYGRSRAYGRMAAGSPTIELKELIEHLGLDRCHLIGVAAGGGVALQFALDHPELIHGLVVANSLGNISDPSYVEMGRWLRPAPFFDALPLHLRELGPSFRASDRSGVERWLELSLCGERIEMGEKKSAAPSSEIAAGNIRRVTFDRLHTLKVPTLMITGDADLYMPPSLLREVAKHIAGAKTIVVPGSGHASYWENPEFFNQTVLDFLRNLDGKADAEQVFHPGEIQS